MDTSPSRQGNVEWFTGQLCRARVPNAACQVSNHILPVLGKKICRDFTIHGDGGYLGHVTLTIYTNFRPPFPGNLYMKFDYEWPSGFYRRRYLNIVNGHTMTKPVVGALVYYKPILSVSLKAQVNLNYLQLLSKNYTDRFAHKLYLLRLCFYRFCYFIQALPGTSI